jgi:hypothetical protein
MKVFHFMSEGQVSGGPHALQGGLDSSAFWGPVVSLQKTLAKKKGLGFLACKVELERRKFQMRDMEVRPLFLYLYL